MEDKIKSLGWTKFLAFYSIIMGGLYSILIVTAIFGVPMIVAGLKLLKGTKYMTNYNKGKDVSSVMNGVQEYQKSFLIIGVLTLVSTTITILIYILFWNVIKESFTMSYSTYRY